MIKQIKILLVEDDDVSAHYIRGLLSKEKRAAFEIDMTETLADTFEALANNSFHVLLLDLGLPDSWGLETVKQVIPRAKDTAIIVLTADDDEENAVETVRMGVQDYLVKGEIGQNLLYRAIQYAIERKRMEKDRARLIKAMQSKNEELKKAQKELTEATAQLVQSEKLSALGELTASVSHELNQPLNGIKIVSQSILRDMEKNRLDEDALEQDLVDIVSQVNRMAEIIDHMRIYTRSTEGTPNKIIDMNSIIEGPFMILDQQLRNHNVEVVKEFDKDLPKVLGDPIRLEQVFMNLINNARNALDSFEKENKRIGIRTYKIDGHKSAPNNSSVVIEVGDNGGGIPEDMKEKIFQPFFTTKDSGKGTGLGLSVTNKIIEEHQGMIEVESNEGEGTTFRVILPVAKEGAA